MSLPTKMDVLLGSFLPNLWIAGVMKNGDYFDTAL